MCAVRPRPFPGGAVARFQSSHLALAPTIPGAAEATVEVLVLGTGAADGIPNPFCRCATCADHRDRGELRTPTSILIDSRLLIDPGPEATRQVSRNGADLTELVAILIGHAHDDHFDPAILLHRSWVCQAPLEVVGPAPVTAIAAQWIGPDSAVRLRTVTAGDEFDLAGFQIRALAANHEAFGEALCYLIQREGQAVLYATDTGPLPEATWSALAGTHLDLILLEETFGFEPHSSGHQDLASFAATLARLEEIGARTEKSLAVAVHLAHFNPPAAQLHAALAAVGAELVPDGTLLQL